MLQACAVNFTRFLYDHCNLPDNQRHIYIYGSKLFFSTSLGIISILLISYLIGSIASGILFVLIFVSIRLFVGGFHAKTYGRCFWLSNSVFLITLGGATLLENCHSLTIALILICSVGVIWTLAPIRNSHHPLSEKTYQKNKKNWPLPYNIGVYDVNFRVLNLGQSFRPIHFHNINCSCCCDDDNW